MKARFFSFLFIMFLTASAELGANTKVKVQENTLLTRTQTSSITMQSFGAVDDMIKKRRKEKRLQFGEELFEIGLQTLGNAGDTYYVALFVAAPIIVLGSGFLIWGALTKDPTKNDSENEK